MSFRTKGRGKTHRHYPLAQKVMIKHLGGKTLASFQDRLLKKFPKEILITHDTPIENLKGILDRGLWNEERSHFGTLGYLPESGFISSKKAVVHIAFPSNQTYADFVSIDMRYADEEDFFKQHPKMIKGDVYINRNVPLLFIKDIMVDGQKVFYKEGRTQYHTLHINKIIDNYMRKN